MTIPAVITLIIITNTQTVVVLNEGCRHSHYPTYQTDDPGWSWEPDHKGILRHVYHGTALY